MKNGRFSEAQIIEDWQPAPKKALFLVARKPGWDARIIATFP